jgi:hypothetical protein
MTRSHSFFIAIAAVVATIWCPQDVAAQRVYWGNTGTDLAYPRSRGLDSNGRAVDVDGRSIDQYGFYNHAFYVDDFRQAPGAYGVPGHYHGSGYTSGGYDMGNVSGLGYNNGLGYSVGMGSYSGGYRPNPDQAGRGVANPVIPPRTISVGSVYPLRTVMNNATRGGVMETTHNGNGYVYTAGSSYQTVITSGLDVFPSINVVQPTQPPVVIEARKTSATIGLAGHPTEIKLFFPKNATESLSYTLNGTVYSIKPGYVQTFNDDRVWNIEFYRRGNRSPVMRYQLVAGTYLFDADENGWDLKQAPVERVYPADTPVPAPPAPAPIPSPE